MKIYSILVPFTLGVFLTVFVYQAYTIYQLRSVVASNQATLSQVVGFLNTQIQGSQTTQPGQATRPTNTTVNTSTSAASSSAKK